MAALDTTSRRDVFHHHPRIMWFMATVMLFMGLGFLVLAWREAMAGGALLPALGAAMGGLIGLAMSGFAAHHAEQTTFVVDAEARRVSLTGRLPWRTRHAEWTFDEINEVRVETWDDSEGKVWRPLLALRSGALVPITTWQNDYSRVDALRDRANEMMRG